ncbi:uncharacterized protein LOC129727133 [Wyeomyia smithii]|uniref:uncharacterized protein LOC129727133 n=1 Tax=Wyeomyia smithii TaxID=174621 RepID=UPI002467C298|nr:uncharacterized protein LOC129727133 [Wyeomyia smithii]
MCHIYFIGIIEIKERQTASFLSEKILQIIDSFNISISQIFSITCDNGANMLAAVKKLKEVYEYEQLCIRFDEEDIEEKEQEIDQNLFTEELNNKLKENLNLVRCAVHTLQLAILDVINKSNADVKKLTDVAKKSRSAKYKTYFECHKGHYPPLWGQTRWGGIYEMVSSFLQQRQFFEKLAEQFPEMDLSNNWKFIIDYEQAFKPLFLTTKEMQSPHVSLSDFYLKWIVAIQKIKAMNKNPFSESLVTTLTTRLAALRESQAFKMALYLDPRLNFAGSTLFTSDEKEEIQNYVVETWQRIRELKHSPTKCSENFQIQKMETENDMFITELFGGSTMNDAMSTESNFMQQLKALEVEIRRPFDFNVWNHWTERKGTHPELSAVAEVVLATPSNQVTVERAFSALALVLSNARSTLSEETLSNILLIKLNRSVFENIIPTLYDWKTNQEQADVQLN